MLKRDGDPRRGSSSFVPWCVLVAAWALAPSDASADAPAPGPPLEPADPVESPPASPRPSPSRKQALGDVDYTTARYEPAGIPLLGGNSDIGFEFGVVGTLSRFADGTKPYAWNMDLVLSASVKEGPGGPEIAQQTMLWNDDIPGLWGGKLRLNPQVSYQRTINVGYFGQGNAASGTMPANYTGPAGRYFEWVNLVARATLQARMTLAGPWSATTALGYRFADPSAYADSKLARDSMARTAADNPVVRGLEPLSLPQVVVGGIYDSRDNEIFTRRGAYNQVAVDYVQGFPSDAGVQYGEAQVLLSGFRPLGPFVLAGRLVADFEFGHVPFYDLFMAGPLGQTEAIGGSAGVRGVPIGRYSGEIKLYGNAELRAMFWKFSLLRQKFTIGGDALFDTGRSWLDYTFKSPLDGNGLGLKYGAGGGLYVLWGQAAIFRIDVAYSPDAAAENPHFPVGLYVEDGTMF
jgi:hypothetical protein